MSLIETQSTTPVLDYSQEKNFPKIIDVREDTEKAETYVKAFLIDDSTNKNFWNVPRTAMKKHATSFIGRPLILHPSGNHPDYIKEGVNSSSANFIQDVLSLQDRYKIGEIIDVREENRKGTENEKAWYAYIRMTKPDIVSKLKSGSIPYYVSPQVYDLNESLITSETSNFIPLHLAVVEEPAYGSRATVRGICNGDGPICMNKLKSAASVISQYVNEHQHSSLNEKSQNNDHKLPQQNYDENLHNNVGNQYSNGNMGVPTNNNVGNTDANILSQQTKTSMLTPDGKVATNTIDIRNQKNNNNPNPNTNNNSNLSSPSSQQLQTQGNNQQNNLTSKPADVNGNPNPVPNNETPIDTSKLQTSEAQLPSAILEAVKNLNQRLDNIEGFKKQQEENQMKKAAEDKRALVEGYITPDVVSDESARESMVQWLSALPVSDDDMKRLLDLITTGGFQSASVEGGDNNGKKQAPKKHTIKSAAVTNAVTMGAYNQFGVPMSNGSSELFDDVEWENI